MAYTCRVLKGGVYQNKGVNDYTQTQPNPFSLSLDLDNNYGPQSQRKGLSQIFLPNKKGTTVGPTYYFSYYYYYYYYISLNDKNDKNGW